MKKIIFAIAAVSALASCSNDELPDYAGGDGLYFYRSEYVGGGQKDSAQVAFYTKQIDTKGTFVQNVDLRIAGDPSDKPRPFKLRQTNLGERITALPGRHYVPFDDPAMEKLMVFPANATQYTLPITLINSPDLQNKLVRLEFEVVPNENFRQATEDLSKFVINFSDQVVQPKSWRNGQTAQSWWLYFGNYSAMKMRYVSLVTGLFDFDVAMYGDPEHKIQALSTARNRYLSKQVYFALEKYNAEHPGKPMLDEFRTPITIPEPETES